MENRKWENIKIIGNMESLKIVKLETLKMWKKIIDIRIRRILLEQLLRLSFWEK